MKKSIRAAKILEQRRIDDSSKGRVVQGAVGQEDTEPINRPKTRADCPIERPCPFVGCRYHLFADVTPSGNLKINFVGDDNAAWHNRQTCALDVAEASEGEGLTLEEVGIALNLTRERVRQIEAAGLEKLKELLGHDFLGSPDWSGYDDE